MDRLNYPIPLTGLAVLAGKDNPAIGIDEEEDGNGRVVKKDKQQRGRK